MLIKSLFDKKERWTQGASARDRAGNAVSSVTATAASWCLIGAIKHCYGRTYEEFDKTKTKVYVVLHELGYGDSILKFNDDPDTRFEMVMEVVEKAGI